MIETMGVERGGMPVPSGMRDGGPGIRYHGGSSPQRERIAGYVRRVFARQHGARIDRLAPTLVSLEDPQGQIRGVAGIASAADGPLFLEQYLDEPVEQILQRVAGQPVRRERIAEIGNLATEDQHAAAELFRELAEHLAATGRQWAVFTATRAVRFVFGRLGVPLVELGRADPARLARDAGRWGTYYQRAPMVVAGHIPSGRDIICPPRPPAPAN